MYLTMLSQGLLSLGQYYYYLYYIFIVICTPSSSDSGHHVHPLAGLGVNLGFGDVSCLHRELVSANDIGEEWGKIQHMI